MRNAETILNIIRKRGKEQKPLNQIYRILYKPEFYLLAYAKLSNNQGAMTKGITDETVDGMNLKKIYKIIELLKTETYHFSPNRRKYIKKKNGKFRSLGLPTWSDKLVQEIMRMILEAYYEPQFSSASHGFRPKRGCHTALTTIVKTWTGTAWFIEGDIKGCFDNIKHSILIKILKERIKDNRFIRLIEHLLNAGYMEKWHYHKTYSGAPQGGVISPILSNIYLNQFDQYIEKQLIPKYTRGKTKARNKKYESLHGSEHYNRKMGRHEIAKQLRKEKMKLPSRDPLDPNYRRLRYIRYADDFLLGFVGSKDEAEEIKRTIAVFFHENLDLKLSEEKTIITHGRTEKARFLGHDIQVSQCDTYLGKAKKRVVNGSIRLSVPAEKIKSYCSRYYLKGRVRRRPELLEDSDYAIVANYQSRFRGIANYYALAHDRSKKLKRLKYVMEHSLMMTLSNKHKTWVSKIYQKYGTRLESNNGKKYKGLQVIVNRLGKTPLISTWGGIGLSRPKEYKQISISDTIKIPISGRVERLKAMLASECNLCGSTQNIEVHHIRALKGLKKPGRKMTVLQQIMAERRRKTIALCHTCHVAVHGGKV